MIKLFNTFIYLFAITLVFFMSLPISSRAQALVPTPHVELAISFDIDQALLRGTMKVHMQAGQSMTLNLDGLTVTGALMSSPGRENQVVALKNSSFLDLEVTGYEKTLFLSYQKPISSTFKDTVSQDSIVLTSPWHPLPDRKSTFSLEAHVPAGFTAISESDVFTDTRPDGTAFFSFSQPIYSLSFVAAPYVRNSREVRNGLFVHTLFFPEDQHLARDYLHAAAGYINRYEKQIGAFPYNHYLIVGNRNPTGYGLPTFTLLGQQVLRLPFIKETSLGHEILHSWFGNSISVRPDSGNWCEGLTTYLADMAYREDSQEGSLARKEKIQEYLSYLKPDTPPLARFYYAGHGSHANRDTRAVGYGRAALLFHELKKRVGDTVFNKTIRLFYQQHRGSGASWQDIQDLFERSSSSDLGQFFTERLTALELPRLEANKLRLHQGADRTSLSFNLVQKNRELYELNVPFTVITTQGAQDFTQLTDQQELTVEVEIDGHPLELVIDKQYDIMRSLSDKEYVPTWSQLMGGKNTTVILADEKQRSVYQPIIDLAARYSWQVEEEPDMEDLDLTGGFQIFLGLSSPLSRGMYGTPAHRENGFTLEIRNHPSAPQQPVALISSSSEEETKLAASRLSHYGKYSYLHFDGGRLVEKRRTPSDFGMRIAITEKPGGFSLASLNNFEKQIEQLADYRVVYIGETHTSRADHLLQMMIVEALHRKDPDIAIGMEMFPRSSQQALDQYIQDSSMSEAKFLRESRYYDVWSYDFRLFRPLFAYARKHKIDIIGLNIDRKIVSSIFKTNGLGNLTPEEIKDLPPDRVLDMAGYAERLRDTFAFHDSGEKESDGFLGFIQAQSVWDETMAESIRNYLANNPSTKMVVIAGSQHTRKDSGIPPRVSREKKDIRQASVSNLATSQLSAAQLSATSDYLFMLDVPDFPPQGKIGVVLQKTGEPDIAGMKIIEMTNPSSGAEAGLQTNDIITHINGDPVMHMDDVRTTMLDKSVGEIITIVVKRVDKSGAITDHTYTITLYDPDRKKTHP